MLDWYTLGAIERHKDLIREVEQYSQFREALQGDTANSSIRVRLLAGLGRWMVEHGRQLEAPYEMSRAGDPVEAC